MKRFTQVFKALANSNRLAIVRLLADGTERHVTQIAGHIHVTMPGTSRHLRILTNIGVLNDVGKDAHVYYVFNPKMPVDIKQIIKVFLGQTHLTI